MSDKLPKLSENDLALIRAELWRRGELEFLLLPHQIPLYRALRAALDDPDALKYFVNCARRFGKTTVLVVIALEICRKVAKAQVRFATYTLKALKKIILPILDHLLETCPAHLRPTWNGQDGVLTFPDNKSQIHIAATNNGHADDLRGTRSDLNIVDEAGFVDELEYLLGSVLIPQTLTTGATTLIATTPARSSAHDSFQVMQECKHAGHYIELDVWKNTSLTPKLIERYAKESGGTDSSTWKREYLCQWVTDTESAIIPEWHVGLVGEFHGPDDEFFPYWHKYVALDIGTRDFTALLFAYYNFREARLYVSHEWVCNGPEMTTEVIKHAVIDCERQAFLEHKPYRRVADNNNLLLLADLTTLHGLHFGATSKDELHAMVNEVRLWVQQGRIVVHPRCKQLMGCMEFGVWDERRKQFERSKVFGHFDALAALIYLVRNVDQTTNPIPAIHGLDPMRHYMPPALEKAESEKTARKLFGALTKKR